MCALCDDPSCPTRRYARPRSKQSTILGTWHDADRGAPTLSDDITDAKPAGVEPSELDDAAWYVGGDAGEPDSESPIRWRIAGPLEFPEYCFGERPGVVIGPIGIWELAAFAERLMTGHEHSDGGTVTSCLLGAVPLRLEYLGWFLPNLRVYGPWQEQVTASGHVYHVSENLPAPPPPRL